MPVPVVWHKRCVLDGVLHKSESIVPPSLDLGFDPGHAAHHQGIEAFAIGRQAQAQARLQRARDGTIGRADDRSSCTSPMPVPETSSAFRCHEGEPNPGLVVVAVASAR